NPLGKHGFDDVLEDELGNYVIVEYKGNGGRLDKARDQMENSWVKRTIARMEGKDGDIWFKRLNDALKQGRVRGIAIRSTDGRSHLLGRPVSEVTAALADAARAWLEVFNLRGTTPDPKRYDIDFRLPEGDPRKYTLKPGYTEESKDYSLTDPADGLSAMFAAI